MIDVEDVLVLLCQKQNMDCPDFIPVTFYLPGSYQMCVEFDMLLDHAFHEATSQGIRNGLTIVALTENTLFDEAFNFHLKTPVPGMQNFLSPNGAMKGLRLIVDAPGMTTVPNMYGLDLPSGVSATISITAKKIQHLQNPYTNCSVTDHEEIRLIKAIESKHPDITIDRGPGKTVTSKYSPLECR